LFYVFFLQILFFFFFFFWDRVLFCSPYWSWTWDPSALAFWVLGFQVCVTRHSSPKVLCCINVCLLFLRIKETYLFLKKYFSLYLNLLFSYLKWRKLNKNFDTNLQSFFIRKPIKNKKKKKHSRQIKRLIVFTTYVC
jgi:hypothetical protein